MQVCGCVFMFVYVGVCLYVCACVYVHHISRSINHSLYLPPPTQKNNNNSFTEREKDGKTTAASAGNKSPTRTRRGREAGGQRRRRRRKRKKREDSDQIAGLSMSCSLQIAATCGPTSIQSPSGKMFQFLSASCFSRPGFKDLALVFFVLLVLSSLFFFPFLFFLLPSLFLPLNLPHLPQCPASTKCG